MEVQIDSNEIVDWLNKNQGVLAVIGIVFAASFALVINRSERKKKQLEYCVISNEYVLPTSISKKLKVTFSKKAVPDASVVIIRLVNTGNVPVLKKDFSSSLTFSLQGVSRVVAVIPTKMRPLDLSPEALIENDKILIKPLLINPSDMIELHILTSGNVDKVSLGGRIAGTEFIYRKELPYPPGSGPEGELLIGDKFVWYWFPVLFGGAIVYGALSSENLTKFVKITILLATFFFIFVIYPKYVKYLDKKRGLWR